MNLSGRKKTLLPKLVRQNSSPPKIKCKKASISPRNFTKITITKTSKASKKRSISTITTSWDFISEPTIICTVNKENKPPRSINSAIPPTHVLKLSQPPPCTSRSYTPRPLNPGFYRKFKAYHYLF